MDNLFSANRKDLHRIEPGFLWAGGWNGLESVRLEEAEGVVRHIDGGPGILNTCSCFGWTKTTSPCRSFNSR